MNSSGGSGSNYSGGSGSSSLLPPPPGMSSRGFYIAPEYASSGKLSEKSNESEASRTDDGWCESTLKKLRCASPLSLKVSLRSIREGRFQTLDQCLIREYRMSLQGTSGKISSDFLTGSIESANAIATGDLIRLSEQELVDCDTYDYGCDGGNMDTAYRWIIKNGGIDSEANYPYTSANGRDGKCDKTKTAKTVVSLDSYVEVESNEDAVFCAVASTPVTIGIQGSAYDFQLYTGLKLIPYEYVNQGVYNGQCSSSAYSIDHAVLIIGYGSQDGKDYWIVKNSWGTYWGMEGYILMERNTNIKNGVCGMYLEPVYPITAAPTPPADQTCCCILEFYNLCLIHGCCGYADAVCCKNSAACCPGDYLICDVKAGYCYKGLAFQLIDDLLDFTGTPSSLGKGSLSDIRHGIVTAPIIYSMEEFPELQSVAGNCAVIVKHLCFVQISPSSADLGETVCSLNFASRVRGVEHGPARKQTDATKLFKYKQLVIFFKIHSSNWDNNYYPTKWK
ncbi:thiol protease [Artemisia annua]|uniref:Thiol protease n=1 Tax=Artemisia annua TaxID=35608 RepID=A0A2U1KVU1_ARTAN|nr:thiol protease [Artemisia annua]